MPDRLLTNAEKNAIRTMPCGRCGKHPPYADGAWTQKHRIIPKSKGGRYTKRNTVPRCPKCHAKEPGHHAGLLTLPQAIRQANGLKVVKWYRQYGHHSPAARKNISAATKAAWRRPDVRVRIMAAQRVPKRKPRTAEHRAKLSAANSKPFNAGRHSRWHVKRHRKNPRCPFCRSK